MTTDPFQAQVTIYYRPLEDASEKAMQVLERVRPFEKFALTEVDVGQDPRAEALHGDQIPVVSINGQVAFRRTVNEDQFIRRVRNARVEMIRAEELRKEQERQQRHGRNGGRRSHR